MFVWQIFKNGLLSGGIIKLRNLSNLESIIAEKICSTKNIVLILNNFKNNFQTLFIIYENIHIHLFLFLFFY